MKKRYYVILAITMTIFSFLYSSLEAHAAGTVTNSSLAMGNNFSFAVQYDSLSYSFTDGLDNANNAEFNFSISLRFTKPADNGQSPHYATGHIWAYVTIPMTFNNALTYGNWTYSYEIDYASDKPGIASCVPLIRHGTQSLIIYYYAYLDNASFNNDSDTVSQATVNFHITAPLTSQASNIVPAITFGNPTLSSNGIETTWSTDPSPYTGWARVISLANEKAIENALDLAGFDDLLTYMYSIYILFPQYMDNILSALSSHTTILRQIRDTLTTMYSQDNNFYIQVLSYLNSGQTEASEAASQATEVQHEMSEVAESIEVEQPTIDEVFTHVQGEIDQDAQQDIFFYLHGNDNMLVTILILVFSLGLCGYVLYGRM